MKEILELLNNTDFIKNYRIDEYKEFKEGLFFKIIVSFVDGSELFIREYSDADERNYSYHWQDKHANLIVRWDNSPYHKEIDTYPHHKHANEHVSSSYEITIKDILTFIRKKIT